MKILLKLIVTVMISVVPFAAFAAEITTAPPTVKVPEVSKAPLPLQATPPAGLATPVKVSEAPKTQSVVKLGYVDLARISAESSLGKASKAQAAAKQNKLQSQIQSRKKQLDKQKAAIEASIASLSPEKREAKAREFQKKVEAFQKFGLNAEKDFLKLQEELGKALFESIEQAAAEYGKANNFALVVVKRELLYVANDVDAQDVSEGVVKLMDKKWLKK